MSEIQQIRIVPASIMGKIFRTILRLVPTQEFKVLAERCIGQILFKTGITLIENKHRIKFKLKLGDEFTRKILLNRNYEPNSILTAMKIMKYGGLFVDVGANFGLFTCFVSTLPNVKTMAIEPYHEAFTQLIYHLKINGLSNVSTYLGCASNSISLVKFKHPLKGNIGLGMMRSEDCEDFNYYTGAFSLDYLIEALGYSEIKLLKLDIEGAEIMVIQALLQKGNYIPENILIEYLPTKNTFSTSVFQFLTNHGYSAYTVNGEKLLSPPKEVPLECNLWFKKINSRS